LELDKTALLLIGFQQDYFGDDGILKSVIEESAQATGVLEHSVNLVEQLLDSPVKILSTPINFTPDYSEIDNPTGILEVIKNVGAFKQGTPGAECCPDIVAFGDRIEEVPGKRGLNAFSNTALHPGLQQAGIKHLVLAGVVTSLCIDSTARAAYERGYHVIILSDCTSGRSSLEQQFYCENIFPLYADVMDRQQLLAQLQVC